MKNKEEALELYKVVVSTIISNEQRRQQSAIVYLGLLAATITVFGALKSLEAIYVAIPGFVIALTWFSSVSYFRHLARSKFKVIKDLEKHFFYQPYQKEWEHFKKGGKPQKGFRTLFSFKMGLAKLDMIIPGLVSLLSGTYILYWGICLIY